MKNTLKLSPKTTWSAFAGTLLISCALAFFLSSCGTVAPKPIESRVASFDGSTQNSGIIVSTKDGFLVTLQFRDRYNTLIRMYGDAFVPPLKKDDGITLNATTAEIDKEHMVAFLDMNEWRREKVPPKSGWDKLVERVTR